MAQEKVEYLAPPEFQVRSPLDYGKIVPAGVGSDPQITESFKAANKAVEDYAKSLEQRFAQPNLFKVAAGFAKPQLGGFLASLGSASEALGQQQEAARAIAPSISRMRAEVASGQMTFAQRMKQKELLDQWRKTGKPMDATTYQDIVHYGADTDVAKAARGYYDAAEKGLTITQQAVAAMGKDPLMPLEEYTKFQLNPDAPEAELKKKQDQYLASLKASKPPQMEQAQWDAMSRYEQMEEAARYGRAQREAGMTEEAKLQQQAQQASPRLTLLGSIRDLTMGVGLPNTVKKVDGKDVTVTGQQQMAALLNYFGGNNPFEVLARAAADGKLGETLKGVDNYARQNAMSPQSRDQFQKLVKLLAENQVSLRNATINPTDATASLQALGSPGIGNSQTALASLVDLLGLSEQHAIEKYKYVLDSRVPFRQLGIDPNFLQKQARFAEQYRKTATSNPLTNLPSWYNPARSNPPQGAQPAAATAPVAAPAAAPVGQAAPVAQSSGAPAARSGAPAAQPSGRPSTGFTREQIRAEIERKKAAQGQP